MLKTMQEKAGGLVLLLAGIGMMISMASNAAAGVPQSAVERTIALLQSRHEAGVHQRIELGVRQAASLWREEDGTESEFSDFCAAHFVADPQQRAALLDRFESNLETLYGHAHEVSRAWSIPLQLELGPVLPVDYLFAEYSPFAHIADDLFHNKIAFSALLNFPFYTLEERLRLGPSWSREEWAEMRLAGQFSARVPAEVLQASSVAYVQADDYISNYNIYMHALVDEQGRRLFPEGLKLISHWGLRDE
ncbi:MAG TPA: hypothetical protein PKJ13_06960, partial [bacterium]|nr:hypothetical protein [bacterium]